MLDIPIKFKFNIDSEVHRVKNTLFIFEWLTKNNYKFSLPENIKNLKNTETEAIRKIIEKEYNPKDYQVAEKAILKSWKGNSGFIKQINKKMVGSYPLKEIAIILTKYGTQGSYNTPNSVIINISNIPPEFLIKTVIHESLHLMIEDLINKYSVEHWVKERLVDLIMDLEYKSRFKMQSVPEWALAVDKIFKENYPDLILITEKASQISFT